MPLPVLELNNVSPLTDIAHQVGGGLDQLAGAYAKRMIETRQFKNQLFQSIMSGGDPRTLLGPAGQALLHSMHLDNDPDVKKLLDEAQASMALEPNTVEMSIPKTPAPAPGVNAAGEQILPSARVAPPELGGPAPKPNIGGYAVNMPQPYVQPSDKLIQDTIETEKVAKQAALEGARKQQDVFWQLWEQKQILNYKNGLRLTPQQIVDQAKQVGQLVGLTDKDMQVQVDENGKMSVLFKTQDLNKRAALTDKTSARADKVYTLVDHGQAMRTQLVGHIQRLMSGDLAAVQIASQAGLDPETAANLAKVAALLSKNTTKEKALDSVNAAQRVIDQVNEQIDSLNTHIASAMDEAVDPVTGESLFTNDYFYTRGKIKHITFQDVSGGLSSDQYIQRKSPDKTSRLVGNLREPSAGAPPYAGPSAAVGTSATEKVTHAFNDLKAMAQDSWAKNPNLTAADLRRAVLDHKDELMAEYGLNEQLFALVMKMGDTVLG
jgi:hypothetical protein